MTWFDRMMFWMEWRGIDPMAIVLVVMIVLTGLSLIGWHPW